MAHLGSAAAAAAAAAMSQEMLGHVHSNSSNLLTLNYQLEHPGGNLTIDLGASGNNTPCSANLTNTSNSPSSNLNEKTSANSHLLSSHSHLHHSSNHLLGHQYAQLHHQPLINSNNVSIFAANQCDSHQSHHHQGHHALLQHGSPIIDLNGSYNGRPGQTVSNTSNASSSRMTPNNSNESDACHTVVVKSEDASAAIYPLPDEEYMADGHLNCSSDQSYRADAVKLESGTESNGLNNVTVSYSTSGYNGYDQLQLGNLSTQLILHPSSPLLSSTSHLQSALNNHSLHHSSSNHLLGGIHHSVIVENGDHPNEQSPSNGKASAGDSNTNDRQSNYNLTLMTAAAVTNAAGGGGLQQPSVIQASGSSSESFGLPPSKRSRKSQSSSNHNNSSGFHSMDLEDDQHLQHQSSLNGQHSQLHSQHLPTTATSQMTADFNLCSENQSAWSMDEYNYNYLYIPKI